MKQSSTFISAMTASACLFFAGRLVVGSGAPDVRPLAKSRGAATVNECMVRGGIEGRTNGVYAVFEFENPTKAVKDITLHYLATRVPPMSMMSRMGPRPETVKKGTLVLSLNEGHATEEVLLKEAAPAAPSDAKTGARPASTGTAGPAKPEMAPTAETWTLVVSREEIKGIHGWGAVGPVPSDGAISLDKGEAVLASTVPEERKTP